MLSKSLPPIKPLQSPHIEDFNEEEGEDEEQKRQGAEDFIDDGDEGTKNKEEEADEEDEGANEPVDEQGEGAPENSSQLKPELNILRCCYSVILGECPRAGGGGGGGG
jgi:hypothetical protein